MVTIAFAGGGTGGHIYPGLAVVEALRKIFPCRVFWIGANTGMDRAIVEEAGVEFYGIPAGKFRRYFSLRNFIDFFRVFLGYFAARKILKREKPALLFSKGGFVSVPPCAAASHLGISVFTHESDYSPGLATRINLRFASRIFTAFPDTVNFLSPAYRSRASCAGNPIRPDFKEADAVKGRAFLGLDQNARILLVLGGSLGAARINTLIRESLPALTKWYVVVHQTGPKAEWDIPAGGSYKPYPFIHGEMPHVIAAAELVFCRSGAGTVFECASLAKPMILLPLSGSGTRGDQVENARYLEKAGAAVILKSAADSAGAPEAEDLAEAVGRLAEDGEKRRTMANAAVSFASMDGAKVIAGAISAGVKEKAGKA
jgi:UDP-N-acetylglucosamine--N-acetylmuramyl-(pentapeptide) pyrophosphoryl-undecaprenol N-acetylglucosamine transferase